MLLDSDLYTTEKSTTNRNGQSDIGLVIYCKLVQYIIAVIAFFSYHGVDYTGFGIIVKPHRKSLILLIKLVIRW